MHKNLVIKDQYTKDKYTLWQKILFFTGLKKRPLRVYFISGMCNSCEVFNGLILPKGFEKTYIEWLMPEENESLNSYTHRMAMHINTSQPFILVGYSFGAIIMHEMNRFLTPEKNIVISSMKSAEEIPNLFKLANRIHFVRLIPKSVFGATKFITTVFSQTLFNMPAERVSELMTYTNPIYIRWAVDQITKWKPQNEHFNTYHIHGTKDQIFPYKQIKNPYTIEDGDHLMVMTHADRISQYLQEILLKK